MPLTWDEYREQKFPRMVARLSRVIGRDVPVDVDWISLGECNPDRIDRFDYDLEMLARGIESDRGNVFRDKSIEKDYAALSAGIERIRVQWVAGIDQCRLRVENGTLDFRYCPHGTFSADQVEALLADRELNEFNLFVTAAPAVASPAMDDLRKHRLPALFQSLKSSLGKAVKIEIEWSSFGHGFEAPPRLLYLLGETCKALRTLGNKKPGMVVGPPEVHAREKRRADAIVAGIRKGVTALTVCGARQSPGEVPVELDAQGVLHLTVFTDPTTSPRNHPDEDLRAIEACRAKSIEKLLVDALKLELNPYFEEIRDEHVPKMQPCLNRMLDEAISSARGLKVPERVGLRSKLERGISIQVDLESFLKAPDCDGALAALRSLETGEYNYNCDYGPFAKNFFYGLSQALEDPAFVRGFIEHVHAIRMAHISKKEAKELGLDGNTLVLRQCSTDSYGMFDSEMAEPLKALVAMLESGAVLPTSQPANEDVLEDQFAQLGAQLKEQLGEQLTFDFDPAICSTAEQARELSQRGLLAILGAVALLRENEAYKELLARALLRIAIRKGSMAFAQVRKRELEILADSESGAAGWPDAAALSSAINEGLALRARAGIAERERESRAWWQEMLRDRFGRDIPFKVDWESFLEHPSAGGNTFIPFELEDSRIRTLLYALTNYMDEDFEFKKLARKKIRGIVVSAAEKPAHQSLTFKNGEIHYRCLASRQDFLRQELIQERLFSLLSPTAGR